MASESRAEEQLFLTACPLGRPCKLSVLPRSAVHREMPVLHLDALWGRILLVEEDGSRGEGKSASLNFPMAKGVGCCFIVYILPWRKTWRSGQN